MATAKPLPPRRTGKANGVVHPTKGGIARVGLFLLAVLPPGLSRLMHGATPVVTAVPANPETPYFKTGTLTLEDRIWAQTQIERVFYNHRIWPKENPDPKPPFETMVPRTVIEAKVTDSLKKSAALDKFWQHPVTGEMLQAELDRMAKQTRDPATLRELFAALHNDPRLIAETLARETLSDRLIRNWYAYDTRFHAEARSKAEAIAARIAAEPAADWKTLDGEYHHQIVLLDDLSVHNAWSDLSPDERHVGAEEFAALKKKYFRINVGATGRSPAPESHGESHTGLVL